MVPTKEGLPLLVPSFLAVPELGITEDLLRELFLAPPGEGVWRSLLARVQVPERKLLEHYAGLFGVEYLSSLEGRAVFPEFVERVSFDLARTSLLVAVEGDEGRTTLVVSDPFQVHAADEVSRLLSGAGLRLAFAPRAEVESLLARAYRVAENMPEVPSGEPGGAEERVVDSVRQLAPVSDLLELGQKPPVVKLVDWLLLRGLNLRASDVHIQPTQDGLQVRFRVDGILHEDARLPRELHAPIVSRVKVMARLDVAERRLAQDGRTTVQLGEKPLDLRISVVPTALGERVVLRLLDKASGLLTLEQLGLGPENLRQFEQLVALPYGVLFATGPTGSGKTTTLYAALLSIDRQGKNVITVEDPIEYQLPGVSQIQTSTVKGMNFATGLRFVLRQDPDVIMVGEVRDQETARMAMQSALTGHLVLSTLHTNDSVSAITRLLDLGVEPFLAAASLCGVLAQRLVRTICSGCRSPRQPSAAELAQMEACAEELLEGSLWCGRGCERCLGTGFLGRTGIYEMLAVSGELREAVSSGAPQGELRRIAERLGLRSLREDGFGKVRKGLTTIEEVLRVTRDAA